MGERVNYREVASELAQVCAACGRDPREVVLVAVSKTVGTPEVEQALAQGALDFGENRPDELMRKHDFFAHGKGAPAARDMRWHFIGNVQSRRIGDIVARAQLIHSVFKPDHLPKLDAAAQAAGKVQNILLEVNISGEESKSGLEPSQVPEVLELAVSHPHLIVRGLMTMAPISSLSVAEEVFRDLRLLRDSLAGGLDQPQRAMFTELSMGMTDDWPAAVAQGATIVRIGRAVFSA